MKVRVYRNLHKKCLSVQHKTAKGWRLWKHVDRANLTNVEFKVYQNGREKVLKEKQKNVHAFVIGEWEESDLIIKNPKAVYYNPYQTSQFVLLSSGEEILNANMAIVEPHKVVVD
jgi:hypothetical protein